MAKKKPNRDGEQPKHRRRAKSAPDLSDIPDRRLMEGAMGQLLRSLSGGPEQDTPLDKAEAILQQAYAEPNPKRRVQLAHDALALCPDCADAYVLLAEDASSRKEALQLYEQAVAAGERALGPEAFQRDVGYFWGLLETRPYMRAREGLANVLWTMGRREEAIQHLQDMLRLNPNDNQGIRYTLAGFLLFLDRDANLARLLEQFPEEESAAWDYTKALLAYRQHGDTPEARKLLKRAKKVNKHVVPYLAGEKFPSPELPGYYSPGDESEALNYISTFLGAWKSTPGAIAWLRANAKSAKKTATAQPKGPLGFIKKWLKEHLPQEDDVWQAAARQMPAWVRIAGAKIRPWVVLVTSDSNDLILAHDMPEETPSSALLWDTLVQAMRNPLAGAGQPHRPTELQVHAGELWEALRPHLEEIGIRLEVREELGQFDKVYQSMVEHVCGQPEPGLLDMPGITPEQVASFYQAAAEFFRRSPWKKVGYEAAIKVECDKYHSGPWYAVLMGQSGLSLGLAVYESLKVLRKMWAGTADDEENARRTVATTVTYGEESDLPVADLEAMQRYGWEVARSDAYPEVYHKDRGMSMRRPLTWELELLEGCLRTIPDFVERHPQDDTTREEVTVRVASGELRLGLSWVPEE